MTSSLDTDLETDDTPAYVLHMFSMACLPTQANSSLRRLIHFL